MCSLVGVVLVLFSWFLIPILQGNRITRAAAENLKPGMTFQQVESILGLERDETGGRASWLLPPDSKYNLRTTEDRYWVSKHTAITVGFDRKTGRVVDVWCEQPFLLDPPGWDNVPEWVRDILQ
jgi:hypothetical protein